jgi:hypothetical protein
MSNNFTFCVKRAQSTLTKALILLFVILGSPAISQNGNGNGGNGNNGGGNCLATVSATFSSDNKSVTATSSKNLSNVVLKYCDGTHQKFDGLTGFTGTFSGTGDNTGKSIEGVWIKSGCFLSGAGPGYGAFVANPDENACRTFPATCYAHEVVSYIPGTRSDGSPLTAARSIQEKALGEPQKSDATTSEANVNFVALGFGGEITIKFEYPIKNGPGADVKVWETTFPSFTNNCVTYPETILAFASQDGCNWKYIGSGCQDTELDLGDLAWAQYIKLIDISDVDAFANVGHIADGYDVDGIECLNGYEPNPVFEENNCEFASYLVSFNQQLRKDGNPVLAERSDALKALGEPQRSDEINFVSLGFGGSITLGFTCVIFDKPGFDIEIVETSYGTPPCNNYPERAHIEGSLDLLSWHDLGEICQDGFIDLNGNGPIQYLRITDNSESENFSNSAETDGFDVDGVVALQAGCEASNARVGGSNQEVHAKLEASSTLTEIFPNPFENSFTLILHTGDKAESWNVRVNNLMGQQVLLSNYQTGKHSTLNQQVDLSYMPTGIYFVTVENGSQREVFKMIKK